MKIFIFKVILPKNRIIYRRIQISPKNNTFGQKQKFWPKIQILPKNKNAGKNINFGQK